MSNYSSLLTLNIIIHRDIYFQVTPSLIAIYIKALQIWSSVLNESDMQLFNDFRYLYIIVHKVIYSLCKLSNSLLFIYIKGIQV